jgi:DNA-binding CsgD family transcriptional regulator
MFEGACSLRQGSAPGFILLDGSSFELLASNAEALQILNFSVDPARTPKSKSLQGHRVTSTLLDKGSKTFVPVFTSGKRRYRCRSFPLDKGTNGASSNLIVLSLERCPGPALTVANLSERFRLTPREGQIVQLLVEGLTSKEIANRLNLSPNTVRTFLHLVMVKMGTSTRSGILGKLFESSVTQVESGSFQTPHVPHEGESRMPSNPPAT